MFFLVFPDAFLLMTTICPHPAYVLNPLGFFRMICCHSTNLRFQLSSSFGSPIPLSPKLELGPFSSVPLLQRAEARKGFAR